MKIVLDIKKSIDQNASVYFEKAKKAKKKLKGAVEALEKTKKQLKKLEKLVAAETKAESKKAKVKERKKEWYEKFRWFISSDGFLCIGGRDATTNDIIIKKHVEEGDLILHTDMAGSPFFVIKSEGKKIPKSTIEEAGQATAVYSKAWKLGLSTLEVFYVKPEQVSKTAQPGEYMAKGAFMIRGKTNYLKPKLEVSIGIVKEGAVNLGAASKGMEGAVMGGPLNAVKKNCDKSVNIIQGRAKASDTAKKIRAKIGGELDDIISVLPAGGTQLSK